MRVGNAHLWRGDEVSQVSGDHYEARRLRLAFVRELPHGDLLGDARRALGAGRPRRRERRLSLPVPAQPVQPQLPQLSLSNCHS